VDAILAACQGGGLEGVDALGGAFEEVVAGFGAEGAVVDYEFFLFAGAAGAP